MGLKIGNAQASNNQSVNLAEKTEREKLSANSTAENEAAINFLANNNPAQKINLPNSDFDNKKTVGDFLQKIRVEQPFDEKAAAAKKLSIFIYPKKPTVADYDRAAWRAIFQKAGYAMLTDKEIAMAVGGMKAVGWKVNDTGFDEAAIKTTYAKSGVLITTTQGLIEKAKRAGQAVLQYQEYQANRRDESIEKGKNYVNEAMGGFVQVPVNGAVQYRQRSQRTDQSWRENRIRHELHS